MATCCPELSPACGPGPGGGGAGRDHERQQREEPVVEADEGPGHQQAGRPRRVVAGGAVDQHHGVDQQEHGGEEVHHDDVGVELGVDDDPAEDGLGQHAGHEAAAQPDEVAPAGGAEDRAQEGGGHRHGQDDGDQSVAELDQAVELEGRGQVPGRARGPVAAAQPRPGQADRRAGDDDERGQDQGQDVEPVAQRGRDGGDTAPRHSGQAYRGLRPGPGRVLGRRLRPHVH